MRKLYIYDKNDGTDRSQADGRFDPSDEIVTLAVLSTDELKNQLQQLVSTNNTFDRVLFQTHGNSGIIAFGDQIVGADDFAGLVGGCEVMFPIFTRVYFDGCDVADGDEGWNFLEAAGKALFKKGGGMTYGWTSLGFGLPGWIPFIGGHTAHPWGDIRIVTFSPGAKVLKRIES